MASSLLSDLDVTRFDAFTVCTPLFWRKRRQVVLGLFQNLLAVGSRGFLVSHQPEVCTAAHAEQVECVVSKRFAPERDKMMSKERWHVIMHFLAAGRRILLVGADVRLLVSVPRLAAAVGGVDLGFGAGTRASEPMKRITHFTPDLVLATPTTRAVAFVQALLELVDAPRSVAGLPVQYRRSELLNHDLAGPAQQDLLFDTLLTVLHNKSIFLHRARNARDVLRAMHGHKSPKLGTAIAVDPIPVHRKQHGWLDTDQQAVFLACSVTYLQSGSSLEILPIAPQ